ncbi:uncharacterized protein LOC111103638 [Crassostrea virginica]
MQTLMTVFLPLLLVGGSNISVRSVLMPGSTPSSPNPNLRDCLVDAGYYTTTDTPNYTYNNHFAKAVHRWCSVYETVLPCAESSAKSNPLRSPADWFFSLIFNSTVANQTSSILCQKLSKFGRKLSCMRKVQEVRALRCVEVLTKPIKKALMKIYLTNSSMVDLAQKASCLISAATATCFREKVNSCRNYLRDYIGGYNLIFGGKCIAILKSPDKKQTTTNSTLTPQSLEEEWMTTIQSLVNEGNGLTIYQRNESSRGDIAAEMHNIDDILRPETISHASSGTIDKVFKTFSTSGQVTRDPLDIFNEIKSTPRFKIDLKNHVSRSQTFTEKPTKTEPGIGHRGQSTVRESTSTKPIQTGGSSSIRFSDEGVLKSRDTSNSGNSGSAQMTTLLCISMIAFVNLVVI